jgi:hypothetical protein
MNAASLGARLDIVERREERGLSWLVVDVIGHFVGGGKPYKVLRGWSGLDNL